MYLLSANGTLRTILVLLILWQLIRLWMRVQAARNAAGRPPGPGQRPRPRGEVRIEHLQEIRHNPPPAHAEDADFEVIPDKPDDR